MQCEVMLPAVGPGQIKDREWISTLRLGRTESFCFTHAALFLLNDLLKASFDTVLFERFKVWLASDHWQLQAETRLGTSREQTKPYLHTTLLSADPMSETSSCPKAVLRYLHVCFCKSHKPFATLTGHLQIILFFGLKNGTWADRKSGYLNELYRCQFTVYFKKLVEFYTNTINRNCILVADRRAFQTLQLLKAQLREKKNQFSQSLEPATCVHRLQ